MGCGLGATLRSIRPPPSLAPTCTASRSSPGNLQQGRQLNHSGPANPTHHSDPRRLPAHRLPSASFDAVYAIESSCYAAGANKSALPAGSASPAAPRRPHRHRRRLPRARQTARPAKIHLPQTLRLLGHRHPRRNRPIQARTRAPRLLRRRCRANAGARNAIGPSRPVGDAEIPVDRRRLRQLRRTAPLEQRPRARPAAFVGSPIGPMAYCIVSATRS